ncbi:hypothetical protein BGZ80_003843 [Entomortierella chlamydospora]|uniref:FAD-binding domain-containing protein n=1 Tax=Entomortierella chlamydospora TaxID=101097 RepID=A0A9P6T2W7_9FUNG|nr:hypothetical protein BGZ79_007695 [Entomortierella chlamydospora]KAG0020654.1 hypothetical protein BGZ80_003843 [Entomortierella chlamydospora]
MAPNPQIIIVGAGIAGLCLAIMLERAGMKRYIILEKTPEVCSLGSALCLSATMLQCFDQLGILQEIIEISKPAIGNVFLDSDLKQLGNLNFHRILIRHVPQNKICFSKRVLDLTQTNEYAQVRCSDNSAYRADIVIGADGAYSGVRQSLYKSILNENKSGQTKSTTTTNFIPAALKKVALISPTFERSREGRAQKNDIRLPDSDQMPLRFDQHAVVGITKPLDPAKYPFLNNKYCEVVTILAKNGFSAWLAPTTGNRISWHVASRTFMTPLEQAQAAAGVPANFKLSQWGPESVDQILELDYVKNQKSPYGGTLKDLFDQTEKGTAVRIMLEDKIFKTWYYRRTVLVGDACHKIIPFSGTGTLQVILDCILLTNALYDMPDGDAFTPLDITRAFQIYYVQRINGATAAVKASTQVSKFVSGNGLFSHFIRKATLASIPEFVVTFVGDRVFANRPILTFLPFAPDSGTRKSDLRPLGRRDREELELIKEQDHRKRDEGIKKLKSHKRRVPDVDTGTASVTPDSTNDSVGSKTLRNDTSFFFKAVTASSLGYPKLLNKSRVFRHRIAMSEFSSSCPKISYSPKVVSTLSFDQLPVMPLEMKEPHVDTEETDTSNDDDVDCHSICFYLSKRYTLSDNAEDTEREALSCPNFEEIISTTLGCEGDISRGISESAISDLGKEP